MMTLSEKILTLRKGRGMSQEELAEKLNVSRQAISRWEMGTAMPDVTNVLGLSKLFGVTTDYLLHDDYQSDKDLPQMQKIETDSLRQTMIFLISLEVMALILQFTAFVYLCNVTFGVLSFIPFVAAIGGFEYAYAKKGHGAGTQTIRFRKQFYKISVWLGTYFPIRVLVRTLLVLYPWPYYTLVRDCLIVVLYLMTSLFITWKIEKHYKTAA